MSWGFHGAHTNVRSLLSVNDGAVTRDPSPSSLALEETRCLQCWRGEGSTQDRALGVWEEVMYFSIPGRRNKRRWVESQPFRFLGFPSEESCLPLAGAKQKGR